MTNCRLCNRYVTDGIHLSDGCMIHESCLSPLEDKVAKEENNLAELQSKFFSLEHELNRRKGIGFKLRSIFVKPDTDSIDIIRTIQDLKDKIKNSSNDLSALRSRLALIYDYYLTYPPDWDERKNKVILRDGESCTECGSLQYLHMHHKTPLARGGNNKISNLILLCIDCHSKKHGGRDLSGEFSRSETPFSKRVSIIRYAIEKDKLIKFGYKKPSEKGYKNRTVKPLELVNIDHTRDSGETLCVLGFCELRKANRHFALKRMRGLKIV